MDPKRLIEIRERKLEIRNQLESGNKNIDLDPIQGELRSLEDEQKKIERRMAVAAGINNGTIEARSIKTPGGTMVLIPIIIIKSTRDIIFKELNVLWEKH